MKEILGDWRLTIFRQTDTEFLKNSTTTPGLIWYKLMPAYMIWTASVLKTHFSMNLKESFWEPPVLVSVRISVLEVTPPEKV